MLPSLMTKVCCYAMYGLIGGPFPYGLYYSAGLDVLANKLRAIGPKVEVFPTRDWSQWRKIVREIKQLPSGSRVVIYGHSMGANKLTDVSSSLGSKTVDLIAAFDPTIWYPIRRVGPNVEHVIWFQGKNFFSIAGHGKLKPSSKFSGKFEKFETRGRHEKIDDNEEFHKTVVCAVTSLLQKG
jgi:alpha-beta hydrolase superfamily lysophospholipase